MHITEIAYLLLTHHGNVVLQVAGNDASATTRTAVEVDTHVPHVHRFVIVIRPQVGIVGRNRTVHRVESGLFVPALARLVRHVVRQGYFIDNLAAHHGVAQLG